VVARRQYPQIIIKDILRRYPGYQFSTKMDVSIQYYTFQLDDESKDLAPLQHHLVNSNIIDYLWDSNVPLILPKR
jgi:hypothetical protein